MSQPDGNPPWFVVHARPHLEMMAAAVIESRLELNIWLPEVRQLRRGEHRLAPLFPGYFFVQAAVDGLPSARSTGCRAWCAWWPLARSPTPWPIR